jgi:preprotein translocase subunit Sec61beta
MAKQEKAGAGFQASAGLIRYFDAEEKSAFRIHPWVVISLALLTGIGITLLKVFAPI